MGADHNRLDALRRLAKDRAATPAKKATARRLAKALADKIGKRPQRGRRRGQGPACQSHRRRGGGACGSPGLRLRSIRSRWPGVGYTASGSSASSAWCSCSCSGSEAVRRQAGDVYLVRTLALVAVALVIVVATALFTFIAWWLKTWRGERLRPALVFLNKHVPGFAMMAVCIGLSAYLEHRL